MQTVSIFNYFCVLGLQTCRIQGHTEFTDFGLNGKPVRHFLLLNNLMSCLAPLSSYCTLLVQFSLSTEVPSLVLFCDDSQKSKFNIAKFGQVNKLETSFYGVMQSIFRYIEPPCFTMLHTKNNA